MSTGGKHGGGRRHPVIRGLLMTLAFILAAVVGFVAFAVYQLQGNLSSVDISKALGKRPDQVATAAPGTDTLPLNVLLVGSDTRDLNDADNFGGTNNITKNKEHSDTTIILHIAADRQSAYGISIPRDSMVHRPDCKNPDKVAFSQTPIGMFNGAYNDGGIGCTVMTVEANTGVRIDHYAVVNFEGFSNMVDALGGVDICMKKAASDSYTGLKVKKGVNHLDGHQASQFVRARHGFGDGGDLGRIQRQQAFLSALVREATDSKLLLRPDRLYAFLDAATKSVTVDQNLASVSSLSDLALQLKDVKPSEVTFITVPTEQYPADHNRVQWVQPEASQIFMAARIDSPLPGQPGSRVGANAEATTSPVKAPTVSPTQISVALVNSSGTPGLAKQAGQVLTAQGFDVTGVSNGTVGEVKGTQIRYPTGMAEAAETLHNAFPDATMLESSELKKGFEVELGPGAADVATVPNRVGTEVLPAQPLKAPTESPTSSASPSSPSKTSSPSPTSEGGANPRSASDSGCI